jgi:hypothetical protein
MSVHCYGRSGHSRADSVAYWHSNLDLSHLGCFNEKSTGSNRKFVGPRLMLLLRDHRHEPSVIPSECERPGCGYLCEPEKVFYAVKTDQNGNYETCEIPCFDAILFDDDSYFAGPRVSKPRAIWITETAHSLDYKCI